MCVCSTATAPSLGSTPPPPPTSGGGVGQGSCPAGWYEAALTVYDSWPYPNTPEWNDYSGGQYLGTFAFQDTGACNTAGEVSLTSWTTPDGQSGSIPTGCHWRHDWVASQRIASVFKSAASPVTNINFNTQIAGKYIFVATPASAAANQGLSVLVADTCGDSDCNNCCTNNASPSASKYLVDLEKNAMKALFPGITGFVPTTINYVGSTAAYQGGSFDSDNIGGFPSLICFRPA